MRDWCPTSEYPVWITVRVWNRHVYRSYSLSERRDWVHMESRMRYDFERVKEPQPAAVLTRKGAPKTFPNLPGLLCDRCMYEAVSPVSMFVFTTDPCFMDVVCNKCQASGILYNPDDYKTWQQETERDVLAKAGR